MYLYYICHIFTCFILMYHYGTVGRHSSTTSFAFLSANNLFVLTTMDH